MAAAYKLPLSSLQSLCQGLERSGVFLRVVLTGGGGGNFPWQIGPAGRVGPTGGGKLLPDALGGGGGCVFNRTYGARLGLNRVPGGCFHGGLPFPLPSDLLHYKLICHVGILLSVFCT